MKLSEPTDYRFALYQSYAEHHVSFTTEVTKEYLEKQRAVYATLVRNCLPEDRNIKILDLGCGYGAFLYFLAQAGYKNATGVDTSPDQVELGKKLGISNIHHGDIFSYLNERPEEYDFITAFDVIEHLKKEEVLPLLKQIFNALKPHGMFLLKTPNGSSPFSGHYRYGDFTHEVSFTASSINQVLKAAGFQDVKISAQDPVIHGFISALRWVLWKGIEAILRLYILIETGEVEHLVLTQNLIAFGRKA